MNVIYVPFNVFSTYSSFYLNCPEFSSGPSHFRPFGVFAITTKNGQVEIQFKVDY